MQIAKLKRDKVKNNSLEIQKIQKLSDILLAIPWLWLGLVVFFIMATWLEAGHFPSYSNPDPKDTFFGNTLLPIIVVGILTTLLANALWFFGAILSGIRYFHFPLQVTWQRIVLFVTSIASIWLILQPLGILEWLMD